jgi:hypothetical protein
MTDELTIKVKASSWARVTRERDEARAECLEQSRLLAMSADREAKLLGELESAKKSLDHSRWVHGVCNPPSPDWEKSRDSQMY